MSEQVTEPFIPTLNNPLRTAWHFFLLTLWVILMAGVVYLPARFLFPRILPRLYKIFHSGCCRIFSMKLVLKGRVSEQSPTLFLSNHVSYLDVFVLGAIIPGYFIAKSEVAGWPILGALAKLQNTLFFERKGQRIKQQLKVMANHFSNGGNLILFPEGTSTEGEHVEPFKPSLLQSVEQSDQPVTIQAVTVAYTKYKQNAMTKMERDHYAWYGTMPFAPHFFSALGLGKSQVEVTLHSPVKLDEFDSRKDCAAHTHKQVTQGLVDSLENA